MPAALAAAGGELVLTKTAKRSLNEVEPRGE
jgi:hypothetical protein